MSRRKIEPKKKYDLPRTVFVTRETDETDPDCKWLNAYETPESIEDEIAVGVYELQEVKTMRITSELVSVDESML